MSTTTQERDLERTDQRVPPAWIFKGANMLVRPLLRSPLHRLLRGKLMLLEYHGRRSGQEYTIPIGYFAWGDDSLISFSSRHWHVNLRNGRSVRLLQRGHWSDAVATPVETTNEKALLLDAFVQRFGPKGAKGLMLGLPGDRVPSPGELRRAAGKTTIVLFRLASTS